MTGPLGVFNLQSHLPEPPAVHQLHSRCCYSSSGSIGESLPSEVMIPCLSSVSPILGTAVGPAHSPLVWVQEEWLIIQSVSFVLTVRRELHLPRFLCVDLHAFIFIQFKILLVSLISSLTHQLFRSVFFKFLRIWGVFQISFCYWLLI